MDQLKEVEMLWPLPLCLGLSGINQQSPLKEGDSLNRRVMPHTENVHGSVGIPIMRD